MSDYLKRAIEMVEAARPVSGFRPETTNEWLKLQQAHEELGYALLRQGGLESGAARKLATAIYSGEAGMLLLDMAFGKNHHE